MTVEADIRDSIERVEVTAKQMNGAEAVNLQKVQRAVRHTPSKSSGMTTLSVRPAGAPKPGENVTLNVAHKIAGHVKGDAGQAEKGTPHIVWMDFIDSDWMGADGQILPVVLFREAFYSGGIWLGLYGRRGDLVLEGLSVGLFEDDSVDMTFDGMFAQSRMVTAVVCAFPGKTVLFENPRARLTIPGAIRRALWAVPDLDFGASYMAMSGRVGLRCRIRGARRMARELARSLEEERQALDSAGE